VIRFATGSAHTLVGNACVEKDLALSDKAMPRVEIACLSLRVERDLGHPALYGDRDQCEQQSRARTLPAPFAQNRHASNVSIGEQPSCAECVALFILRQHMDAIRVDTVPFKLERDRLLVHEYGFADLAQPQLIAQPVCAPDSKRCDHLDHYSDAAV